jgi:4-diphosphocytidyl-2-C-methyl-D-erythritol kinase
MPATLLQRAPAKLNLALAVGPARADGMHPIASWMVTVSLFDDLELRRLMLDQVSRYAILWHDEAFSRSDINWNIRDDLAVRAHFALEAHVGVRLPVQLKLEKRIPIGGGLGGGSSNAAAMLIGVNDLFELGLSRDELASIGAGIGSDVPFLVHGGSALVEGVGEEITRHDAVPKVDAVIAFPAASCPTGAVYSRFDARAGAELRGERVHALLAACGSQPRSEALFNDLGEPAMDVAPAVREAVRRLGELAELPVHVTGSGSSIFVLCDDAINAEALAAACTERLGLPAVAVRAHGG